MMRVALKLALLLSVPLAFSLVGCFTDPQAGETNTAGETGGAACPDGSAGCDCYGNNTCNDDLLCMEGTCKLPECVEGSLNCDCYQGECFSGLVCSDGTCKPEEAMPGCESVSDCDGNLCTQGDETCDGMCIGGTEVQCPIGATCDPSAGSCACEPGMKVCDAMCIPETQCCTSGDCPGSSTCAEGFCTCDGGLMCNGECKPGAQCCSGETSTQDCMCGAKRTCNDANTWSECQGGNQSPECTPDDAEPCGNCGTSTCTADCSWTECQGEGVCAPFEEMCTMGMASMCTSSCFWLITGDAC